MIAFNYADPSKVLDADMIGAITSGVYRGMKALHTTFGTMGFFAKILIAPGYSQDTAVATANRNACEQIRAIALVDLPAATPATTAISNRGIAGNAFGTSSNRAILVTRKRLSTTPESCLPGLLWALRGRRCRRNSMRSQWGHTRMGSGFDRGERSGAGLLVVTVERGDRRNPGT